MSNVLEPDRATRQLWAKEIFSFLDDFVDGLEHAPASNATDPNLFSALATGPGEGPADLPGLVERLSGAVRNGAVETAGPGYFAYFPAGGLYSSVLGEALAQLVNRFTGVYDMAPGMVAVEQSVISWFCREFGLASDQSTPGGLLTSGASMATLTALHTAREHLLDSPGGPGTIYVTEQTHHCVAKAARITGFGADQIRTVAVDSDLRMDVADAMATIRADRAVGKRPFLIVGTAGSTSTGTVDPLDDIARLAASEGLWFHADGAYGGGFWLTERGRAALSGIERADSLTLDPHKSLFLPYGTGLLLVRDEARLRAAHTAEADYLQDLAASDELADFSDLGPELTRDSRGLRLWLPLHLHGVAAFREALDEKIDLARWAYAELANDDEIELVLRPDLTVLVFRSPHGEEASRQMLRRINAERRVFLSSTRVAGEFALRMCVLSHRTHREHVERAVAGIRRAAKQCGQQ